jgi:hypothetical protein
VRGWFVRILQDFYANNNEIKERVLGKDGVNHAK